ncbi:hypothetical protein H0H81_000129 [Sphagnurus paluster]|uniref:Uncharacterized protein n=1 Tax=Sphagnurus paluster TaxID=117069 RepID=A0A9P7KFG3_9AGAR|nr:hypothetical protein H0H81_000129 [Sphagnurus paluster]
MESALATVRDPAYIAKKQKIIGNFGSDTETLVEEAKILINELATSHLNKHEYSSRKKALEVDLSLLLDSLLFHVDNCGGEAGARYMAASIIACGEKSDRLDQLRNVAITFLTHFLFMYPKHPHYAQMQAKNKRAAAGLKCARILSRVIAHFDPDSSHKKDKLALESATHTFDVLRHYANIPDGMMTQLVSMIDQRSAFEQNNDARQHTQGVQQVRVVPNEYKAELYCEASAVGFFIKPESKEDTKIQFVDHNVEFVVPDEGRGKNNWTHVGVDLPNEIHAAIGGVLHMSGTGKFFDELLDQ